MISEFSTLNAFSAVFSVLSNVFPLGEAPHGCGRRQALPGFHQRPREHVRVGLQTAGLHPVEDLQRLNDVHLYQMCI